jgi:N-acetylgalactosamine kinase
MERLRETPSSRSVRAWLRGFSDPDARVGALLASAYGADPALIEQRRAAHSEALRAYAERFGDQGDVFIVRTPGRINLMGVHIEHRGGYVNYMTIARELIMVAGARHDDCLHVTNTSPAFAEVELSISEPFSSRANITWEELIRSEVVPPGRWENYLKASLYYLQHGRDAPLHGFNAVVHGDIPMAAGLSSSSALVVATMEAAAYVNGLRMSEREKVEACGRAEWYAGTRGGAGDHAAMIFGKQGFVTHLRFFPLEVEWIAFPERLSVVACNSMIQAAKSAGARDTFNQRVATYEIGLMLLREQHPAHRRRLEHLRDVNTEHLRIDVREVYAMLWGLPERATRQPTATRSDASPCLGSPSASGARQRPSSCGAARCGTSAS